MKDIEKLLGLVLRFGLAISAAALVTGLLLIQFQGDAAGTRLLSIGVVVLIATPVTRVLMSSVVYAVRREWTFMLLTLIVLAELIASIVAAVRS